MENTFFEDYTQLINGIDKINKTAEGFGYAYLELTPLLDNILPKLQEHNFILIQTVFKTDGIYKREEQNAEGIKRIETPAFVLNSKLVHKTGEIIECNMPLYVDDIDPQAIGSAETYMRRYSIYALLNIKVSDDDGLGASAKAKKNKENRISFDKLTTYEEFSAAIDDCKSANAVSSLWYYWSKKFNENSKEYKSLDKQSKDMKLKLNNPDLNVTVRK